MRLLKKKESLNHRAMEMRAFAGCEELLVDNETTTDSGANRAGEFG